MTESETITKLQKLCENLAGNYQRQGANEVQQAVGLAGELVRILSDKINSLQAKVAKLERELNEVKKGTAILE